ncbi:unnamed protein product [Strongylus vulgaris]|uniref:Uncharacterized protein n=1 Tax=Strongylus vulgaris TaxID=40348 RepID=A0A3P7L8E4_STRVU|nr:unnamed protein product [Strongylus vulgaris]
MLELAPNCHKFDSFPPLEEDELVTSTDKVDRKKRRFESRSQACEYGRKIQRRGCPARQPLQSFAPAEPPRVEPPLYSGDPSHPESDPYSHHEPPRIDLQPYSRPEAPQDLPPNPRSEHSQHDQSPYDEYARRYMERLSQQRIPQRHAAAPRAQPCPEGICPTPPQTLQPLQPPVQSQVQEYTRQPQHDSRYRPAPPPPPACHGEGCLPPNSTPEWCEWSTCSGSCGRGERTRTRFCLLGTQRCEGKDFEIEACDAGPCPEWADWEEWSRCSASCGSGVSRRQRTCLGGIQGACPGKEYANMALIALDRLRKQTSALTCRAPPGHNGRDGQSAHHSVALDNAHEPGPVAHLTESTLCEGTSCCRWSDWCDWSNCDRECGIGHSIRSRACVNGEGMIDSSCHCEGPNSEQKECNTQPCALQCSWTQWCAWSACSTMSQCEIGIQSRSRQCVGEPGCHCLGLAEENQQCRGQIPCSTKVPC